MRGRHPIRVAARRSGLSEAVIRSWEMRYGAVRPSRSRSGRRLYTDDDIRRLRLLKLATAAGRRISEVAGFSLEQLDALSREDEAARAHPTARAVEGAQGPRLDECLAAIEALDADRLHDALAKALRELGATLLSRTVLAPLMLEVGRRWRKGSLRIVHEHLASVIVGVFVANLARSDQLPPSAPRIVVATPSGHHHELGALLVTEAATQVGWKPLYLGANLPAEEIATAVAAVGARAIALSLTHPAGDPRAAGELRALRKHVGLDVALLLGGQAAASFRQVAEEVGALMPADLEEFKQELERIARQPVLDD